MSCCGCMTFVVWFDARTDYREEQAMEVEALEAIYMDDFTSTHT